MILLLFTTVSAVTYVEATYFQSTNGTCVNTISSVPAPEEFIEGICYNFEKESNNGYSSFIISNITSKLAILSVHNGTGCVGLSGKLPVRTGCHNNIIGLDVDWEIKKGRAIQVDLYEGNDCVKPAGGFAFAMKDGCQVGLDWLVSNSKVMKWEWQDKSSVVFIYGSTSEDCESDFSNSVHYELKKCYPSASNDGTSFKMRGFD